MYTMINTVNGRKIENLTAAQVRSQRKALYKRYGESVGMTIEVHQGKHCWLLYEF